MKTLSNLRSASWDTRIASLVLLLLPCHSASLATAQEVWTCGTPDPVEPVTAATNPPTLGEIRVLVILANFQADPQGQDPSPPPDFVYGQTFGGTNGPVLDAQTARDIFFDTRHPEPWAHITINDWFREASFDQMRISGEVTGYHTLPVDVYPRPCTTGGLTKVESLQQIAQTSISSASSAGFDVGLDSNWVVTGSYDNVVIAVPTGICAAGTVLGRHLAYVTDLAPDLVIHELGHNFGLPHAWSKTCGTRVSEIDSSGQDCTLLEYGNPFDPMGAGNPDGTAGHYLAWHKELLGWSDLSQNVLITQPGNFVVTPLETPGGLKRLTVRRGTGTEFDVEFRQELGFDGLLADRIRSVVPEVMTPFAGAIVFEQANHRPALLDMAPETHSLLYDFFDAALPVAADFVHAAEGVRIRAVSITGNGPTTALTVAISFSDIESVDCGADRAVPWGSELTIVPMITGGTPPYSCQWEPTYGILDPKQAYSFARSGHGFCGTRRARGSRVDRFGGQGAGGSVVFRSGSPRFRFRFLASSGTGASRPRRQSLAVNRTARGAARVTPPRRAGRPPATDSTTTADTRSVAPCARSGTGVSGTHSETL
jgi:hypothetical protein